MKKNNSKKIKKKAYSAPKLTRFGSAQKLTRGAGAGALDDGMISFT
ncbi:MAG: hypothetical protein ACI8QF_001201 [Limisphaerales bacterium]|jgi:hypothetical protein